jgi:hypothetical protein
VYILSTIKDFSDYRNQISGYLRFLTIDEDDYIDMLDKFQNHSLDIDCDSNENIVELLRFNADIFALKYYFNIKNLKSGKDKEKVQEKLRRLYERIHSIYPEKYRKENLLSYYVPGEMPSHFILKKFFKVVVDSGYPHQTLVFCTRNLLEKSAIDTYIKEVSAKQLDDVYDRYVNLYSQKTGIPAFAINIYHLGLKEKLGKKLGEIILKNDSVTHEKMKSYLDWITGNTKLEFYFGKDIYHDISDWSNKVKVKVLKKLVMEL